MFQWGGGGLLFRWGGGFIFKWRGAPWASVLVGGGFEKNCKIGEEHSLMPLHYGKP